jgi:hypothetical protein
MGVAVVERLVPLHSARHGLTEEVVGGGHPTFPVCVGAP